MIDGVELEGLEVVIIQGTIRGSFFVTASLSLGFYYDYQTNTTGLLVTPTLGIGVAGGVSAGFSGAYYHYANIKEVSGWGWSQVGEIAVGPAGGGLSLDHSVNTDNYESKTGGTYGYKPFAGVGLSFVAAVEGSYTWNFSTKSIVQGYFNTLGKEDKEAVIGTFEKKKNEYISQMQKLVKKYSNLEKASRTSRCLNTYDIDQEKEKVQEELKKVADNVQYMQDAIDYLTKKDDDE